MDFYPGTLRNVLWALKQFCSDSALASKPASPAQRSYAEKIAQEKSIVIPEGTKASSVAMSAWINSNRGKPAEGKHNDA